MAPSMHKPPMHPNKQPSELDVETYRLPRWDAQGNLIDDRPKPIATVTEDIEDVQIQPPSAEEVRQIHDDAFNEGFESGYQQGMKQGQQEGHKAGHQQGYEVGEQAGRGVGEQAGYDAALKVEQSRIDQELEPLKAVLEQLQGLLPKQEAALREGMVALAVRLARNLFDAELVLKPDHIQALVHSAIQALPNADERLTIELHPDDLALVEPIADSHWTLQAGAELNRGGCRVRSRFSYIDYSLEHRFRQQVSNLLAQSGLSERLEELSQSWPLPAADAEASATPLRTSDQPEEVISESRGRAEPVAAEQKKAADGETSQIDAMQPAPDVAPENAQQTAQTDNSANVQPVTDDAEDGTDGAALTDPTDSSVEPASGEGEAVNEADSTSANPNNATDSQEPKNDEPR